MTPTRAPESEPMPPSTSMAIRFMVSGEVEVTGENEPR